MAERRAHAVWNGSLFEGSGKVSFDSSGFASDIPVSWPARTEEPEGKTSPEELIAGAHAACFSMALSNILAQDGNPADELHTGATTTFEKTDAGFRITRIRLEVAGKVPGLDEGGFEKAAEKAKEGCPVSNALTGVPNIEVSAKLR